MAPDRGVKKTKGKSRMLDSRSAPAMKKKASRQVSAGKQIRDLERLLKRDLPQENRSALEKRVKELRQKRELDSRLKLDRKLAGRYKQVKFIERRKVERRIRRAEIELRNASDEDTRSEAAEKLESLKEDLEYVRFYPKSEKYISLFMSNNDQEAIQRREKLREVIRAKVAAAAATGVELEESPSEDDYDYSEDDFFMKETEEPENSDDEEPRNQIPSPGISLIERGRLWSRDRSNTGASTPHQQQQQHQKQVQDIKQIPEETPAAKSKRKRKRKRPQKK